MHASRHNGKSWSLDSLLDLSEQLWWLGHHFETKKQIMLCLCIAGFLIF